MREKPRRGPNTTRKRLTRVPPLKQHLQGKKTTCNGPETRQSHAARTTSARAISYHTQTAWSTRKKVKDPCPITPPVESPCDRVHGLEDGTRKGNPRARVLSSCELVSTDAGRRSGTVTSPLKLVKKIWLNWPRNQISSRAGAHGYGGLAGASRGVSVTPSGCSALARNVIGLTLSQFDLNAAASQRNFGTLQDVRLTSRHSFFDATPSSMPTPSLCQGQFQWLTPRMATETVRLLKNIAACHDPPPTACRGESWNVMPAVQPANDLSVGVDDPPAWRVHTPAWRCNKRETPASRSGEAS